MSLIETKPQKRRGDTKAAANYMGISHRTLEQWRLKGGGPKFLKLGSRVVYDFDLLDDFLASHAFSSTSEISK